MRDSSVRRSERVDEEVHQAQTEDGLSVRVLPKPGYQKQFAILLTDYGSIDTSFQPEGGAPQASPEGVAHFLEHKLFEDVDGDVFDAFARLGASANAYTSYTETAYHFATSNRFYPCLDLLLRFVGDPYFTDEQIEKERQVIAQEIRMYEDSPGSVAHLNLLKGLYHRLPIREDIPGTLESIQAIDKAHLELCHRTFYRPDNMMLVVAGDLSPGEVFARVEAARAERAGGRAPAGELVRFVAEEPTEVREARVEQAMRVSAPQLLIGYKDDPVPLGADFPRHQREVGFLLSLIFGRSGAFFERHSASGLIDDTFSFGYQAGRGGYAYLTLGGETPDPAGLEAAVDEAIEEARREGLQEEDLTRLRNKTWGRYLRSFNSLEAFACGEADAALQGWDLLAYLEVLEGITLAGVQAHLERLFDPARRAVSLISPSN